MHYNSKKCKNIINITKILKHYKGINLLMNLNSSTAGLPFSAYISESKNIFSQSSNTVRAYYPLCGYQL
jgi:hypothetical protein